MKCPGCSADLAPGAPTCGSCGAPVPQADLAPATNAQRGFGTSGGSIQCDACGAQVMWDASLGTASCPYCGSTKVVQKSVENVVRPDFVIPFKVTKDDAQKKIRENLKGFFQPGDLQQKAEMGPVRGVYLPYWYFDCKTSTYYSAEAGKDRSETYYDTDAQGQSVQRTRTVTDWSPTWGWFQSDYSDLPVLASNPKGLDRKIMKNLEKFDMAERKPYDPTFLQGFEAEVYSVDSDQAWKQFGKEDVRGLEKKKAEAEVKKRGANRVRNVNPEPCFTEVKSRLVMVPFHVTSYKYGEKTFRALANGQSGQVYREAPLSPLKVGIVAGVALVAIIVLVILIMRGGIKADKFEPNETRSAATALTLPVNEQDLTLHAYGDKDYYKFTLDAPATVTVTVDGFVHNQGSGSSTYTNDVDITLMDGAGNLATEDGWSLASSAGIGNSETFSQALQAGTYYLKVYFGGFLQDERRRTRYHLSIQRQ